MKDLRGQTNANLKRISEKLSSLIIEEQFIEAEKYAIAEIKQRRVKKVQLANEIFQKGIEIGNSKDFEELQRHSIALKCFRISMNADPRKQWRKDYVVMAHDYIILVFL